jgi:hypothetical protein
VPEDNLTVRPLEALALRIIDGAKVMDVGGEKVIVCCSRLIDLVAEVDASSVAFPP